MFWCCCDHTTPAVIDFQLSGATTEFVLWKSPVGDLDPLPYDLFTAYSDFTFSFQWPTLGKRAFILMLGGTSGFISDGIPVQTYTNFQVRMGVGAFEFIDLFAGIAEYPPDVPIDLDVYAIDDNQWMNTWKASVTGPGISRADLVGPISWNAASESWYPQSYKDTPDLSSIVNPVINGGGWTATSSLKLLFDPRTGPTSFHKKHGRQVSPGTLTGFSRIAS